jgi:hypothetical protein
MKSLEEAWSIIEELNDDAHNQTWDTWIQADELSESEDESDWDVAEDLREQASLEQAEYFRELWYELDSSDQEDIKHWLNEDDDFKEQFAVYFGEEEFENEFGESNE